MIDFVHRRTFLGLLGAAGSASALPSFAMTAAPELILIDTRLTDLELARLPIETRHKAMTIDHAGVLHWRRKLSIALEQGGSFTAYTLWDMALLLSDLGRDAGRTSRRNRAGGGVMITRLDLRHTSRLESEP